MIVGVGVMVGVGVIVGVLVSVGVRVGVYVGEGVCVDVDVKDAVGVRLGVSVGVVKRDNGALQPAIARANIHIKPVRTRITTNPFHGERKLTTQSSFKPLPIEF